MQPDEPGKSPFAPADSPEAAAPPEPPRLGISHLLILTACVAVHFALMRTVGKWVPEANFGFSSGAVEALPAALYGIGWGAALAGMVLVVARRRRGLRFPVHPGEYLLVLRGFSVLIGWASLATAFLVFGSDGVFRFQPIPVLLVVSTLILVLLYVGAWVWTVVGVKSPRWRVFLLAMPASYFLGEAVLLVFYRLVAPSTGANAARLSRALPPLIVTIVLAAVVLKDHLDGKRYPWTHWFGVATSFWIAVSTAAAAVWYALLAA